MRKTHNLHYQGAKENWRHYDALPIPEGPQVLFWLKEKSKVTDHRVSKFRSQQENTVHKSKAVYQTRIKASFEYE